MRLRVYANVTGEIELDEQQEQMVIDYMEKNDMDTTDKFAVMEAINTLWAQCDLDLYKHYEECEWETEDIDVLDDEEYWFA